MDSQKIVPAPTVSWWTNADRQRFTERAAQELARMQGSREYQQVGNAMVIGQIGVKRKGING